MKLEQRVRGRCQRSNTTDGYNVYEQRAKDTARIQVIVFALPCGLLFGRLFCFCAHVSSQSCPVLFPMTEDWDAVFLCVATLRWIFYCPHGTLLETATEEEEEEEEEETF